MRHCKVCGQDLYDGMMDIQLFETKCCCEDCFEQYMDREYGKGHWKQSELEENEENSAGGYYEADGEDLEIFYTTFDEDEED